MVLSWLACATLGAVAVTTNTKSVGAEMTYFAEHTGAVAAITQPQYAAMVAAAAPALKWIAVTDDNSGEPATADERRTASTRSTRCTPMPPSGRRARRSRCCRSGSCSPRARPAGPKAVVHTHANAIWASRIGPRNIDLTHRRHAT